MKKRLVWIGGILLALLLAAYLVVPNWILAKPREALIEAVRQELAADWQSEAVAFVGEGVYSGETVLWFTIETPGNTQYKAAVCRVLENGRYRLTKIENPSTYCSDICLILRYTWSTTRTAAQSSQKAALPTGRSESTSRRRSYP